MTPDLSTLPPRVDRETGADLVTRHFFRVSPRTLEAWHLPGVLVGGRRHVDVAALFAEAQRRLDAAQRHSRQAA